MMHAILPLFLVAGASDVSSKLERLPEEYYSVAREVVRRRQAPLQEDAFPQHQPADPGPDCCRPHDPCWPTTADIAELSNALDPHAERNLHWRGLNTPFPLPLASGPKLQPLFGENKHMKPVYVRMLGTNLTGSCVVPDSTPFCRVAARNLPAEHWEPAFVVWPLNAAHVQKAVSFAQRHRLCVSVAGTGHDFINRHSSPNGIMIRTGLLKGMDWSRSDAVKLGSGHTFSEVIHGASQQSPSRFVVTGWASTVGITGWSLGGGHGPLAPSNGMGVDNLLEVELVTSNGTLVTTNAEQNSELFWALRGGGGSTWGVVTSLTVRTHPTPAHGMTRAIYMFHGETCGRGEQEMEQVIDHVFDWSLGLDEKWGGLMWMLPGIKVPPITCTKTWSIVLIYWYAGPRTDADFQRQTKKVLNAPKRPLVRFSQHFANWWAGMLPVEESLVWIESWVEPFSITGNIVPSATISRETVSASLGAQVKAWFKQCKSQLVPCVPLELYQDVHHPNFTKHLPPNATSISSGLRNAMIHLISPPDKASQAKFMHLGENSYFSESAYYHEGDSWKQRYWGSHYEQLLSVKMKYDPENMFWCHHCVGSDRPRTFPSHANLGNPDHTLLV